MKIKDILSTIVFGIPAMFFLCAGVVGCDRRLPESIEHRNYADTSYCVIVIDGCQYIRSGHGIAHKGNCTNSIHKYQVENK